MSELLVAIDIEPAGPSQQLAVLRRAGLVVARRAGSSVRCSLTGPQIAQLLGVARSLLGGVLSQQVEPLDDLRTS